MRFINKSDVKLLFAFTTRELFYSVLKIGDPREPKTQ